MFGEIENLWSEDTDENIVRTWLTGTTDGQTYPINNRFLTKLTGKAKEMEAYNFHFIEGEWDDIIGPCDHLKLDDPVIEKRTKEIVEGLNNFIGRINANPEKYFKN